MAYNPILDVEIDPESPGTQSLFERLRDNPIAIASGEAAAPRINPAGISVGGKGADGTFNDATAFTLPGYFDFLGSAARTANLTLPYVSRLRYAGNLTASGTWTVAKRSLTPATATEELAAARQWFDLLVGGEGTISGGFGGGGGGLGAGGSGVAAGGAGLYSPVLFSRPWVSFRHIVGGNGGLTSGGGAGVEWGPGGGSTIIIIDGDFNATGLDINANGGDTNDNGAGGNQPGGGGAGSLIVIVTGTLTGGTFRARGGKANVAPGGVGSGGGGGGGWVQLVASAFSGAQTFDVTGGTSSAAAGTAGYSNSLTLSADFIRTLLQGR